MQQHTFGSCFVQKLIDFWFTICQYDTIIKVLTLLLRIHWLYTLNNGQTAFDTLLILSLFTLFHIRFTRSSAEKKYLQVKWVKFAMKLAIISTSIFVKAFVYMFSFDLGAMTTKRLNEKRKLPIHKGFFLFCFGKPLFHGSSIWFVGGILQNIHIFFLHFFRIVISHCFPFSIYFTLF